MVDFEGLLRGTWFPMGKPHPPLDVRLDAAGERLLWREPLQVEPDYIDFLKTPPVKPEGMLDAFVRINGSGDVLRFARRYGPLRLCEHGFPSSHRPQYLSDEALPPGSFCLPTGHPGKCSEPVDRWNFYVGQAKALLEIGAALWQGRLGPKAAWESVFADHGNEIVKNMLAIVGEQPNVDRASISAVVYSSWLRAGDVRLCWWWGAEPAEPSFWVGGHTFDFLAVQLAAALSRAGDIAICDGCSQAYPRKRRPQRMRRNFCAVCGVKVSNRLRQRDLRARRKEGTNHVQTS